MYCLLYKCAFLALAQTETFSKSMKICNITCVSITQCCIVCFCYIQLHTIYRANKYIPSKLPISHNFKSLGTFVILYVIVCVCLYIPALGFIFAHKLQAVITKSYKTIYHIFENCYHSLTPAL